MITWNDIVAEAHEFYQHPRPRTLDLLFALHIAKLQRWKTASPNVTSCEVFPV